MGLRRTLLCMSLVLAMTACERAPVDSTPVTEFVVGKHDRWQAGTHYEVFEPLAGMAGANGKVTVVEFFWYGCPHCYTMDPHVTLWNRKKQRNVEFQRVPTLWGDLGPQHARLFYTLQVLGRTDLHGIIFDTIHAQGNRLAASDEQQTLQMQLEFARQHGIDPQQFMNAYGSNEVEMHLRNAERLLKHYRVTKLPTLLVNGKYKTDVSRTDRRGEALMRLVDDLTELEGKTVRTP
ncbi:MAG TPA: thiol:disulfide interchange protein DsbA/DsbL [Steroidobacter sp.]|uniref:thiol:disulfide interchange protein DsbA/DsbL n=1 Tax=Steroidobacter sp. TaxID=1978227 RepID=UPI002EDA3961